MTNYSDFIKVCESQNASQKVSAIIAKCSHFKIGKTGENLEDRRNQPDYAEVYPNIEEVYSNTSKVRVSDMESYLIDRYQSNSKCDNIKDGNESNNDPMTDSSKYYVYVVWK